MDNHVYKTIEITGSSSKSVQDAIEHAVARAGESLHSLRWFEVLDTRGHIEGGTIVHWQVSLKVGFTLDESNSAG